MHKHRCAKTHLHRASGCSLCGVALVACQPRLAAFGAPPLFLARRRSRRPVVAVTMAVVTVAAATATAVAVDSPAAASAAVVLDITAAALPTARCRASRRGLAAGVVALAAVCLSRRRSPRH